MDYLHLAKWARNLAISSIFAGIFISVLGALMAIASIIMAIYLLLGEGRSNPLIKKTSMLAIISGLFSLAVCFVVTYWNISRNHF